MPYREDRMTHEIRGFGRISGSRGGKGGFALVDHFLHSATLG
jgi:hypothetical protein